MGPPHLGTQGPWDRASLCCLKARKEELVAPLFSGKADWLWEILQAPFPSFPSEKPGPRDNWEGSSSICRRGRLTVSGEEGAGLSLVCPPVA